MESTFYFPISSLIFSTGLVMIAYTGKCEFKKILLKKHFPFDFVPFKLCSLYHRIHSLVHFTAYSSLSFCDVSECEVPPTVFCFFNFRPPDQVDGIPLCKEIIVLLL